MPRPLTFGPRDCVRTSTVVPFARDPETHSRLPMMTWVIIDRHRARRTRQGPHPRASPAHRTRACLNAGMPTTHVLVALSSVAFTAASGHTLRAIRERRDPAYARRARARRQSRATPRRGAAVTPFASAEIEALRVCPPWHEEELAEERGQLGELDGRVATNPAGVFRPAVVVGDLAYVSGQVPRLTDGSLIVGSAGARR